MASETQAVKNSKKTRKMGDEGETTSRVDSSDVMEKERKKKSKKRAGPSDEGDEETTDDRRKKRRRKGDEAEAEDKDTGDVQPEDTVSDQKRKKDKPRDQKPANKQLEKLLEIPVDEEAKEKEKKKSRKSKSKPKDVPDKFSESITPSMDRKKTKRKSKSSVDDSDCPNPALDETLSDKSRGALSYTWTRIARPESWKFNKAHQNWIVKHVFSTDSIPDKYFATVASYLKECKGGVRQNLLQVCQQHLNTAEKPDEEVRTDPTPETVAEDISKAPESPEKLVSVSAAAREDIKRRARTLLDTLQLQDTS